MSELKNILLATDFSEMSAHAARTAVKLCGLTGASLHVVSVVEQIAGYHNLRFPPDTPPPLMRPLVDSARHELDAFITAHLGTVDATRQHFRAGRPYEEILHAVRDSRADLVVMGTHGRKGIDRVTLGSVAERVVANCTTPVLAVQKTLAFDQAMRILVATDLSPSAERAADVAGTLARLTSGRITLLAVLESPHTGFWRHAPTEDRAQAEARVRKDLDAFAARALGGVKPESVVVRSGTPAVEIVAASKELGVDLMAMGSRGESGVAEWVLGSVVQRVLRDSAIPLLAARAT
ncbi:MAG: universal stress protein [Myxococcota bacterium]